MYQDDRPFDPQAFEKLHAVEALEQFQADTQIDAVESLRHSLCANGYDARHMPDEILASGDSSWITRWLMDSGDGKVTSEADEAEALEEARRAMAIEETQRSIGDREPSGIEPSVSPTFAEIKSVAPFDGVIRAKPSGTMKLTKATGWIRRFLSRG